jgi:hypothetical protein
LKKNERKKKPEVGSPKSVQEDSFGEVGVPKSEVKSPKSEEGNHSEIEHPKSEINQMEVHHHPQLEHKPKPWKEYLLEYLMIFLAVMTGFFAESYREHRGERSKEREYIINIKKDLITESKNLNIWIPSIYTRISRFDTLISYLETTGPVKNGSNMYYLARLSTRNAIFEPSDNTILEMKSSGNLRLIRNREIVNSLMNMERTLEQYRNLIDIEGKEDVLSYPLLGQLFDATIFDRMISVRKNRILSEQEYASQSISLISMPPGSPQLINHDKEKINLLIYYVHQRKSSFLGEARQLMGMRKLVEKIIKQIDKEYNLGDE